MAGDTVLVIDPGEGLRVAELAECARALELEIQHGSGADDAVERMQDLAASGLDLRAVLIRSDAASALGVARQVHHLDPLVQIVFLADETQAAQLRRAMGPAPRIGDYWSIASPEPQVLKRVLQEAAESTRQRRHSRTTLNRLRLQLPQSQPLDHTDYRRLVLSDRYLASILNHAQDAILSTEPDGSLLTWNNGAVRLFGYQEGEVLRRPLMMLATGSAADRIEKALEDARGGRPETRCELQLRRADGSYVDTDATFAPVRDENQHLLGISAIIRDITERKCAEEEVRRQREWLRVTLSSIGDAVITTDIHGCVTFLNPVAERLTGWVDRDAKGQPLETVFPILHEQTRQPVENPVAKVLREGRIVGLGNHTVLLGRDGTETPIDDSAAPITDTSGTAIGVVLVFRDVTDKREAEAALRESEEKLRLLADTIPQLAWMARPDGYIFWYNRRWYEYTGTSPDQMEGWGWEEVHDPEVLPRVMDCWRASLASGEPFEMVFPMRGADGHFRPFLTRVQPLRSQDERILYWFGTNTDISEIKKMEEALREADRRKDEFLATLAHELRNPLAPLQSALEILKMPGVDAATAEMSREMMERQIHHLVRLIDDLLDVSRVVRGKVELRPERVELTYVVARAVESVEPLINSRRHELTVQLPPEPLELNADPVRLNQIIGNLLTNAAKYTESSGRIWLTASREERQAVIEVRDNGIGIASEMLPRIFDLFVQVPGAARSQDGLGIGLTLVKNLVAMHGGTVEAHSAGSGQGSTFTVRLPLATRHADSLPEPERSAEHDAVPIASRRFLVVDDNRDAAESLAMLLRLRGHEAMVVHDGPTALEAVKQYRPDMVFLDIGMPGMDGYEVARRLRAETGLEGLRLAALTGWGQEADRRRSADAGFDHHVVKPVTSEVLVSLIAELEQRKQAGGG